MLINEMNVLVGKENTPFLYVTGLSNWLLEQQNSTYLCMKAIDVLNLESHQLSK